MTKLLSIILFIIPIFVKAEELKFPQIENLNVVETFEGYINKDNEKDLVVLYQETDPSKIKKNKNILGVEIINENNRKIIVFIKDKNKYIKVGEAKFPQEADYENFCKVDPFNGVTIEKNILTIKLHNWSMCENWDSFYYDYSFSYNQKEEKLRLIDKTFVYMKRNTGDKEIYNTNFLTKKETVTTNLNEFKKTKKIVKVKNLEPTPITYFDNIDFNF